MSLMITVSSGRDMSSITSCISFSLLFSFTRTPFWSSTHIHSKSYSPYFSSYHPFSLLINLLSWDISLSTFSFWFHLYFAELLSCNGLTLLLTPSIFSLTLEPCFPSSRSFKCWISSCSSSPLHNSVYFSDFSIRYSQWRSWSSSVSSYHSISLGTPIIPRDTPSTFSCAQSF